MSLPCRKTQSSTTTRKNAFVEIPDTKGPGRQEKDPGQGWNLQRQPHRNSRRPEGWRFSRAAAVSHGRRQTDHPERKKRCDPPITRIAIPLIGPGRVAPSGTYLHLAAEGHFDKTLSVNGAITLNVSTGSGYIHIIAGRRQPDPHPGPRQIRSDWMGGSLQERRSRRVNEVVNNPPDRPDRKHHPRRQRSRPESRLHRLRHHRTQRDEP